MAIAAASWAIVSLEARMVASIGNHIEADCARFVALGSNAVAEGFPGILGHEQLQLCLGKLVLSMGARVRMKVAACSLQAFEALISTTVTMGA